MVGQPKLYLRVILVLSLVIGLSYSSFAQSKGGVKSITDYTSIAQISGTANGQNVKYENPYTHNQQETFAGTFNGTLNGHAEKFYCIDLQHYLEYNKDYWDEGSTPPKMTYVLNNYFPYKTSYPGKLADNPEAASVQLTIWHFSDGVDPNTIVDATIKARTLAIIADANANYNTMEYLESILIIPPSQSFVQGTTASFDIYTMDVNGDPLPNTPVTLSTTLGTLSATTVTTDASGHAGPITLTYSGLGTATISAKADVTIPQGTRFVHKTLPGDKQKLVLATPSFDEKEVKATVIWYEPQDCDTKGYTTFTPGGWGSPSNSAPGKIRDLYFNSVFPSGLTVGGLYTLKLTSAQAVEDFLPSSGTPAALTQNYIDPAGSLSNTLASHVVSVKLAVEFDKAGYIGTNPDDLEDLFIATGPFEGYSVQQFLAFAESVLGGGSLNGFTYSQITDAATAINENFDNGTVDNGFLTCEVEPPPSIIETITTELCADNGQNVNYNVATLITDKYSNGDVKFRLFISKTLNDNTYGTNAIGWPSGHTFSNLTGSDEAEFKVFNGNNSQILFFTIDYIEGNQSTPSTYGARITSGASSNILSFNTSLARNFNEFGYVLTTNSPATNSSYAPNPSYPNWIFDMVYEATIKGSAFGASGFGRVEVVGMHNSPDKLGFDNLIVPEICAPPCENKIGDFIWHDKDVDGIQDANEPGIKDVVVELLNATGTTVLATDITDASGKYEFANLLKGTYQVRVAASNYATGGVLFSTTQTKWYSTKKNQGTDDSKDSDANKNESVTVTLNCADNMTIDFGFYKTCISITKTADKQTAKPGDVITYTFVVENCGDIKHSGGVDVYDAMLGMNPYHINYIEPGQTNTFTKTYTVKSTDCGELVNTVKAIGHPIDGSANVEFTATATVTIECKAAIGDKVWEDLDKDGIQETGENGVPNVTVKLYDCDNNLIATQTTDTNGNYLFSDLNPGDYYVLFVLPSGYVFTTKDAGSDDAKDSDADITTGKTICTTLTVGETDLTWDAGIYKEECKNKIGDFVWHDKDTDGIQDANELGIPGVKVELLDSQNNVIQTSTTNSTGYYEFSNVPNGTYKVRIAANNFTTGGVFVGSASEKWFLTFKDKGTDDKKDSDGDANKTATVTVDCNDDLTIDFGFFKVCVTLEKTGPTSVNVGEKITYTFTVTNCGDVLLSGGANVYDPMLMPSGDHKIKYLQLQPGQVATFPYEYTTDDSDCGELVNNAWVIGHPSLTNYNFGGQTVRDDDSHTVTVICEEKKADLEVKKTASKATVQCGETFSYTITVKNLGPDKSEGIVISDLLPTGADYQSHTASQGTYNSTTGFWTVGDLNSGSTATLTINVKADCDDINNGTFDLGIAKDYNLFVIEDVNQPSSDTQGKVAVGGNATFANYSIGDQLPPNSGDVLIVGKHLQFTSGAVYNGNVVYGNTTNLPIPAVSVSGTVSQGNPIDFVAAKAFLLNLSSTLSGYATNGTTTMQWGGLTLTGTDPFLNVFNVNGSDLSVANNVSINVPNGSVVLVNVNGTTISWTGGLTVNGTSIGNVLYNFYQATSMTIQGIDIRGSLLAPKAHINFVAGVINGQLICKSLEGMGQMNLAPFIGNIPYEKEVTNTASVHSVITNDPNPNNNSASVKVTFSNTGSGNNGGGTGGNNWQQVNGFANGEIVYTLLYKSGKIYAGTWGGKIYMSSNNGQTWSIINNGMNVYYIWSLQASGSFIFAATEQGVFKFNGTTWALTSLSGKDVHALATTSTAGTIYAGTWGFGVYKSTDYGTTWTAMNNGLSYFLTIQSLTVKGSAVFAGTVGGGVFKSINGGTNWTQIAVGNNMIWALGGTASAVFASSFGDGLYRSLDNGATWAKLTLNVPYVYAIVNYSSTTVYVASYASGVFKSTDNGNTWTSLGMGGLGVSSVVVNEDNENVMIGTKEGKIYFSNNSGLTDVDDNAMPSTVELNQNYPNPFNPSTTIQFALPEAGRFTLKIYNIVGQEVATLVEGELNSGIHKVNFDASRLASGVYIYKLVGNNVNISKKMILMK